MFARFGVGVTVVEAMDRLLSLEEPEVGELIERVLTGEGISVVTGTGAAHVVHQDDRFTVTLSDDRKVEAERLLVATGRRADLRAVAWRASASTRASGRCRR